jgi:hypothetical protein
MAQLLSSVYSWVSANPYLAGVGASAAYILLRKLLARDAFQIRNVAPIIKNPKVCCCVSENSHFHFCKAVFVWNAIGTCAVVIS